MGSSTASNVAPMIFHRPSLGRCSSAGDESFLVTAMSASLGWSGASSEGSGFSTDASDRQ